MTTQNRVEYTKEWTDAQVTVILLFMAVMLVAIGAIGGYYAAYLRFM